MLTFDAGILAASTRAAAVANAYEAAGLDPDDFEDEIAAVVDRLDTVLPDSAPETTSEAIVALLAVVGDLVVSSTAVPLADRVSGGQAAIANVAAAPAAISGGESPTEAEHNDLRTTVAALVTTTNTLLAELRTANVIDDA